MQASFLLIPSREKRLQKRPQAFLKPNYKNKIPLNMRSNDDDRRQWRKQGGVVGAASSKTQVPPKARCGCWVPQPDGGGHSKSSHIKRLLHKTLCSSLKYFTFTTDQMLNCTAQKAA